MLSRFSNLLRCDLAIDLGTASTRVALPGEGVVLQEPSVVAVARISNRILSGGSAVGQLARQMWGRTPESVNVVRPLSAGVITDFQLCEAMLRYFLHKARPTRFGLRPRLLVAAPACITPVEKRAIYSSAHRAGAGQVMLVAKSQAAALGAGLPIGEPVASMLIDIGAGITEVAILSLGDVVAGRAIRVGGDQMDQAVVEFVRRSHNLRIGISTAERLRMELADLSRDDQQKEQEVSGIDVGSGLPKRMIVRSGEIREAISQPLECIVDAVRATIDQCSPDLVADVIDRGMVLCGGGAMLKGLELWIQRETGIPARLVDEPFTAVARGTVVCLEHLEKWRGLVESSDGSI